jgi:hypothetical protein
MLQVVGLGWDHQNTAAWFLPGFFFMGSVRVGASPQKIQLSEIEAS